MTNTDLALLLLRLTIGGYFIAVGYRKSWDPVIVGRITGLLKRHGWGSPVTYWLVTRGQFLAGLGIFYGCLTQIAAAGLLVILVGAIVIDTIPTVIRPKAPQGAVEWTTKTVCTAEFQFAVISLALILSGAGAYSFDAYLFQ